MIFKYNKQIGLTFSQFREANQARLPVYKNSKGEFVHKHPQGKDWSPAQWLQATTGELGEYANFRKKYERGDIDYETFREQALLEIADTFTYLDLLALQFDIDLGEAIVKKFNMVSERINCDILIQPE